MGSRSSCRTGSRPLAGASLAGNYYWWGGKADLVNAHDDHARRPIAIPAGGATLSSTCAYGIETEWDFLWVQASIGGWHDLEDPDQRQHHLHARPGAGSAALYGFPEDLCAAGIGGFTDYNASFPDSETETFDLAAFAGKNIWLRFWYMTDWAHHLRGPVRG